MHRQHRVEQVGEPDAVGLGDQAEQRPIAVEAPRPPLLDHFELRLPVTEEQDVAELARRVLVRKLDRRVADPLDGLDGRERVGDHSPDGGVGCQVFEAGHGG